MTTWSAAAMASSTASGTGGLGGLEPDPAQAARGMRHFDLAHELRLAPAAGGPSCWAHSTTATAVAGSTRPRPEQLGHMGHGAGEVPGRLAESDQHQVAERVAVQFASRNR